MQSENGRRTEILLGPVSVAALAKLVDLEPLGLGGIELVASGASALGEVGEDGTSVMGPLKSYRTLDHKHRE